MVRATRVGDETTLAHLTRLLEQAQAGKARIQRLADRVSAVFVPIVIALALATLADWVAAHRREPRRGAYCGGRGPRHRLPVRARVGDADGADGGGRTRCPAWPPHSRVGGTRVDQTGGHHRAGQDRHGHRRSSEASRLRGATGDRYGTAAAASGSGRGGGGTSDRTRHRRRCRERGEPAAGHRVPCRAWRRGCRGRRGAPDQGRARQLAARGPRPHHSS